jgi:hypothetical protein
VFSVRLTVYLDEAYTEAQVKAPATYNKWGRIDREPQPFSNCECLGHITAFQQDAKFIATQTKYNVFGAQLTR